MRIAVLYLRILVGGVERVLDGILPHLTSKHEIAVFTETHLRTNFPALDSLVKFSFGESIPKEGVAGLPIERRRLNSILREIMKWRPDAILVNGSRALRYTHWVSIKTGIPTIPWFHSYFDVSNVRGTDSEYRNTLTRFYRERLTPRGLEFPELGTAKLAICVSKAIEKAVRARFPKLETKIVYNGVDPKTFAPTWEDENYALSISRFSPEKNLELLVRALCPSRHPVVFYGTVGKEEISSKASYFDSLKSYKCRNVSFEVHKNQGTLMGRLQKCSIFLNPSPNEGFGLTTLEAMACGKAIIAHNSGGTPEVVDQAGYLLGDKEEDWRIQVDELMESEALRKDLGRKAYERSKQFTWKSAAESLDEALETLV